MTNNLTPRWMQPLKMVRFFVSPLFPDSLVDHIAAKVLALEMNDELLILVCEIVRG